MKRFFTLIVISQDGKNKREYNINLILFRSIIGIMSVFLISVLLMAIYLGNIYSDAVQKRIYESRVKDLEREVAKIDSLKTNLAELYTAQERINALLGIDIQNKLLNKHRDDIKNMKIDSIVSMESLLNSSIGYPDIWPVKGIVSREFSTEHPAIDIAAVSGSPVISPMDGQVISLGWDQIFGNYVKIKNNEITVFFGHLDKVFVENRQQINKGEIVGLVGNTGRSTAPHLHYEIQMHSMLVNPRKFLP